MRFAKKETIIKTKTSTMLWTFQYFSSTFSFSFALCIFSFHKLSSSFSSSSSAATTPFLPLPPLELLFLSLRPTSVVVLFVSLLLSFLAVS
ncbi:hypothetical protein AALP_AA2G197900 [Arabis alpina]|uniref:Transmembrane protein n=1 Tax=Arabis alpina TaxID=50452 RepID=A0A087HIN8_ARAAL|nr:hypothetical protein AALP_AA2G197900 [Arabis alpina]